MRSIKLMPSLLVVVAACAVFAGTVSAQPGNVPVQPVPQTTPDADVLEIQKLFEKSGVKNAERIQKYLPPTAKAMFKTVAQGGDTEAIEKAYEEALKQIPRGGGNR